MNPASEGLSIKEEIWIEKYRPEKLDDIVGQDEIVRRLKSYVKTKACLIFCFQDRRAWARLQHQFPSLKRSLARHGETTSSSSTPAMKEA